MQRPHLPRAALPTTVLLAMLAGCSQVQYKNASHPGYGNAEYKSDQAQCTKQNSKIVMSSGYDDKSEVQTDDAKVRACMADRGWQPT